MATRNRSQPRVRPVTVLTTLRRPSLASSMTMQPRWWARLGPALLRRAPHLVPPPSCVFPQFARPRHFSARDCRRFDLSRTEGPDLPACHGHHGHRAHGEHLHLHALPVRHHPPPLERALLPSWHAQFQTRVLPPLNKEIYARLPMHETKKRQRRTCW